MKTKIVVVCAVVVLSLLLSGCVEVQDDGGGGEVESKMSFTEIRVGDTPTEDFSHINVTFSEIKLHKSGGNDSGWFNFSINKTVDLIYLHINNLTEQLIKEEIDVGNYSKLWIVVDNATGVLNETNETIYFDVPSGTLKIQHLFDFRAGNNTVTVDIDLDNSILVRGEIYKLLPVIGTLRVQHANGTLSQIRDHNRLKNMTENRPPAIDVVVNGTRKKPVTAVVDQNISFNASGTFDIEGDNITYDWDFDDGTNATGPVVTHSYDEHGSYWVVLTVSDDELGATEIIEIHIVVKKTG